MISLIARSMSLTRHLKNVMYVCCTRKFATQVDSAHLESVRDLAKVEGMRWLPTLRVRKGFWGLYEKLTK